MVRFSQTLDDKQSKVEETLMSKGRRILIITPKDNLQMTGYIHNLLDRSIEKKIFMLNHKESNWQKWSMKDQ